MHAKNTQKILFKYIKKRLTIKSKDLQSSQKTEILKILRDVKQY